MKHFTSDWFFSRLAEEDMEKIAVQYWNYIDSVFEKLPFALKILAKSVNLHDGNVIASALEEKSHTLTLELFCGDLQSGYFLLQLIYTGISEDSKNFERLEKFTEVHAAELEAVSNGFSHRLLLSSGSEVEIKFLDVSLQVYTKTAKDYKDIKSLKKQMVR
jgi:hypothetical protein